MKTLSEINAEAKKFAPDNGDRQFGFVQGVRWILTGHYYREANMFQDAEPPTGNPIIDIGRAPTFEEWWDAYDYKKGRKKAEEKWNRLKPIEKIACMKAVRKYVASTIKAGEPQDRHNFKPYRLHPLTYLNGARWEDEIEEPVNHEQQRIQRLAQRTANLISSAYHQ